MKQVFNITLILIVALFFGGNINAQVVPTPPTAPEPNHPPNAPEFGELPEPPSIIINIDESKWKEWGESFAKNFDSKKWEAWGKQFEESFKDFDKKISESISIEGEVSGKIKQIEIKLKDFEIPELPELPEIPTIPAMPEVVYHNNWKLGSQDKDASEKIKKLTKTYPVDANDMLIIQNSYGKIDVKTWNKSEIKVDVEIKAYAKGDEDAQELLDGVSISNAKYGNQISFKTIIEKSNRSNSWMSSSFWSGNNTNNQKVEVYYTVYMPEKNGVNFKTNYTNIVLPNLSGDVIISMNYGDIITGNLNGRTNIKSNYGKLNFKSVDDAVLTANYGSLKIEETKSIIAYLNYCHVDLGELSHTADLKINYSGGFKIGSFDKKFKSLNLNANYSSINLDFNNDTSFNFDISTTYASFKYDGAAVKVTNKTPSDEDKSYNSRKTYKGYYGKSPSGNVTINSNYGAVKFN